MFLCFGNIFFDLYVIELEGNQEPDWFNERSDDDDDEDQSRSPEMADESILDGEVGKRINQMVPIRVSLYSVSDSAALNAVHVFRCPLLIF